MNTEVLAWSIKQKSLHAGTSHRNSDESISALPIVDSTWVTPKNKKNKRTHSASDELTDTSSETSISSGSDDIDNGKVDATPIEATKAEGPLHKKICFSNDSKKGGEQCTPILQFVRIRKSSMMKTIHVFNPIPHRPGNSLHLNSLILNNISRSSINSSSRMESNEKHLGYKKKSSNFSRVEKRGEVTTEESESEADLGVNNNAIQIYHDISGDDFDELKLDNKDTQAWEGLAEEVKLHSLQDLIFKENFRGFLELESVPVELVDFYIQTPPHQEPFILYKSIMTFLIRNPTIAKQFQLYREALNPNSVRALLHAKKFLMLSPNTCYNKIVNYQYYSRSSNSNRQTLDNDESYVVKDFMNFGINSMQNVTHALKYNINAILGADCSIQIHKILVEILNCWFKASETYF